MKMLTKIALCFFLVFTINAGAQNEIKDLKVGDTIPELVLKTIIGQEEPVKLSSLHQHDLLIIQFWATWCAPCVRELSTLDSLVALNRGKLTALSVAYENRKTVKDFLKRRPDIKTSHLNLLTDDNILVQYFKHHVIPHNVWVNKQGVVKHITGGDEINQKNIDAFYENTKMNEHEKRDVMAFDYYQPFHLRDSAFSYRSIETPYIDGIFTGEVSHWVWHHPTERWLTGYFAFNISLAQLLWTAINREAEDQNAYGEMKILTKDSLRFYFPELCKKSFEHSKYKSRADWMADHLYCYELTLPAATKDSVFFPYVLNDLERIFSLKIDKENQKMPVCVLSLVPGRKYAAAVNDSTFIHIDHDHLKAHNVTIKYLCEYLNKVVKSDLNAKPLDPPYLDDTGLKTRIDLEVKFDKKVTTYAEIQKYMTDKAGIRFKIEEREYPVTIVKDLAP